MSGLAELRGLTLTQPWASLVALGHKQVETRSWSTKYRGLVAIHAAKGMPRAAQEFASTERALGRLPSSIPVAAIVAVARIDTVVLTEEAVWEVSGLERYLGNYEFGRYAWMLRDVRALPDPIPCRGALSLWTVPPDVQLSIAAALDRRAA